MNTTYLTRLPAAMAAALLLGSCGSYENITANHGPQDVPAMKEYNRVSGKPALKVPARMGVLTSGRLAAGTLGGDDLAKLKPEGIASVQPVAAYVASDGNADMAGMLQQRAMIIDNTRHLGLDLILLCDQTIQHDERQYMPPLQWLTLGIVNPESASTVTQLDAVLMDARTGYIYGAIGDAGKGSSVSLTFIEGEVLRQSGKDRASSSARKQLAARFPEFWAGIRAKYQGR